MIATPTPRGLDREAGTLAALRRVLLALFFLSAAALAAELLLLDHTESLKQLLPFLGLGAAVLAMAWLRLRPGPIALRVARVVMLLLGAIGLAGVYLHYRANVEFVLERDPSSAGWALLWQALHGGMPALAPGLMGQLGLLGLAYTFRRSGNTARNPLNPTPGRIS